MTNCPICDLEYVEEQVSFCPVCGWDLAPYPVTFLGQIPDTYIAKQKTKLNWGREVWFKLKHSSSLTQAEIEQLQQEKTRLEASQQEFQAQFEQERLQLQSQVDILNHEKSDLLNRFKQLEQERLQLQSQVDILNHEKSDLLNRVTQLEQKRSHLQNQVEQITQEKECLSQRIGTLERERSKLELQKNREQIQLKAELSKTQAKSIGVEQERKELQKQLQEAKAEQERLQEELNQCINKDEIWEL